MQKRVLPTTGVTWAENGLREAIMQSIQDRLVSGEFRERPKSFSNNRGSFCGVHGVPTVMRSLILRLRRAKNVENI